MAEANQAYLSDNSSAMTRRALLAAPILLLYREPIPPPFPITCQSCPIRGMPFQHGAIIRSDAQTEEL